MQGWKRLGSLFKVWRVVWSGQSTLNQDLKVLDFQGTARITTGGYTQSKRITPENVNEGYWYYQAYSHELGQVPKPQILILGLGGGTLVTLLKQRYPEAQIDGVDLDPTIVELGKTHLGLRQEDVHIFIDDALLFSQKLTKNYDLICVDVFQGNKMPESLEKVSFYRDLRVHLNPGGAVTINRIYNLGQGEADDGELGKTDYEAFRGTLASVFGEVEVVKVPSHFSTKNYIFKGAV